MPRADIGIALNDNDPSQPLPVAVGASGARSPALTVTSRSSNRLSFKITDEFFHCMLSYRVRTEGPEEKGGNNLARLIYDACCSSGDIIEKSGSRGSESLQHYYQALGNFGKWPTAFSGQSEPIRIFLDQVNLRMGVPWKGTGDTESGGFLGAVAQALLVVPLFSATPARFKVVCTESPQIYALSRPINMKLANGTELLSIQIDEVTGTQTIRGHICRDVQSDGSFQLSGVTDDVAAIFPSKFEFCSTTNFLPSDGSGPRGSMADLLTLQQKPEELTFSLIDVFGKFVILRVDQLSDHVFFCNEMISLRVRAIDDEQPNSCDPFKIVQVLHQGSKVGAALSQIKIDAGAYLEFFTCLSSPISGSTIEIDRCDNVLMELMLCRALRTLSAAGNLHPCKLIMPVFVDDMDMLYPLSERLSEKQSNSTSAAVQGALQAILKRTLTRAEEGQWIHVSVKAVVKFYFDFQGLQLSDKSNRCKNMKEKASIVHKHIVTTTGIEAHNNALFQYISNNPLAHELLDFLDSCGLLHLHSVLVKHDITSVKEFSLLSASAIEKIAHDGHELSTRPLMKETVEISCAVCAAQSSKLALPVSKRLELFEDKEASFLTVIYSSYAIYIALQKPFFSLLVQSIFIIIAFGVGLSEVLSDPAANLPYIFPNFVRALWLFSSLCFVHFFNSLKAAIRSWVVGSFMTGVGFVVGFILDKFFKGKFELSESKSCASYFSPSLYPNKYSSCIYYLYAYAVFNALFYLVLFYLILYRQNVVWRSLLIGVTVQIIMTASITSSTDPLFLIQILGCFFVPGILAVTEILRFYGRLQALQITKRDSVINAKNWERVLEDSRQDLKQTAQELNALFDFKIVDNSSDLGTWNPQKTLAKSPPPICQPITDFDELYNIASVFNNTFQAWIESFFGSEVPSANFLYVDDYDSTEHLHQHLQFESFRGFVSRGPVKLPERAIAKVSQIRGLSILKFMQFSDGCVRFTALIVETFL